MSQKLTAARKNNFENGNVVQVALRSVQINADL